VQTLWVQNVSRVQAVGSRPEDKGATGDSKEAGVVRGIGELSGFEADSRDVWVGTGSYDDLVLSTEGWSGGLNLI